MKGYRNCSGKGTGKKEVGEIDASTDSSGGKIIEDLLAS